MTRSDAELDIGGTGSVLAIWSILIVVIGAALFIYSLVVTFRGRRKRRRRRRPSMSPNHQPTGHGGPGRAPGQPGPGQHTPGQHTQGQHTPGQHGAGQHGAAQHGPGHAGSGQPPPGPSGPGHLRQPMPPPPASRPLPLPAGPTVGGVPVGRHLGLPRPPAALPPGPHSRPLPLPGSATQRFPSAPPPIGLPTAGSPPALPSGSPPALPAGTPALPAGSSPQPPYGAPLALPAGPAAGSGHPSGPGPTTYGTAYDPTATATAAGPGTATPSSTTYGATTYGTAVAAADPGRTIRADPPTGDRRPAKAKKGRPDPCAALRAECEQLREVAATAAAAAAQAATDAESAHADFVSAQRDADEARRAIDEVVREANEVANQVAQLERVPTDGQEKLQAETSHAAFAAYRRGDISAEQLREVFKRAEGWTPEHDRLSRRSTELRAQETELIRIRDASVLAEQVAGDHARTAAITARSLDEQARTAAVDARGRCAAADACEQRGRRR